jgi:hypothetical protein
MYWNTGQFNLMAAKEELPDQSSSEENEEPLRRAAPRGDDFSYLGEMVVGQRL